MSTISSSSSVRCSMRSLGHFETRHKADVGADAEVGK